jgi:hypothetical protein
VNSFLNQSEYDYFYLTTDITEYTGKARIVSVDLFRVIRVIRGELVVRINLDRSQQSNDFI